MYPAEYLRGILLFRRGDYFESHDAWEEIWRGVPRAEKDFYKGLIHTAVGLCHYYNGNMRGAEKLYRSAREHLQGYMPSHLGLDLVRFVTELDRCFAPVLGVDPEHPTPFDPLSVPSLELVPEPEVWPEIDGTGYHDPEEDS